MAATVPPARTRVRALMAMNALGLAVTITACGGSEMSPSPVGPGEAPTLPSLRGGERLSWDQAAASSQEATSYQYILYVDGRIATFDDIRCGGSGGQGTFVCSGRLPSMTAGRHVLELSASSRGVEGGRSNPLTVTVVAASEAPGNG